MNYKSRRQIPPNEQRRVYTDSGSVRQIRLRTGDSVPPWNVLDLDRFDVDGIELFTRLPLPGELESLKLSAHDPKRVVVEVHRPVPGAVYRDYRDITSLTTFGHSECFVDKTSLVVKLLADVGHLLGASVAEGMFANKAKALGLCPGERAKVIRLARQYNEWRLRAIESDRVRGFEVAPISIVVIDGSGS